jgi:transcriptional regulator with XRE-family HTH domain
MTTDDMWSQIPDLQRYPEPLPTFGVLLKRYRLAADLTQARLAERAKLSARGISDLERGERHQPRRDTVRLLADALELSPAARSTFQAASLATTNSPVPATFPSCNLSVPSTRSPRQETEVAAVVAGLKRNDVWLLTLTGVGGVGKTCLAQEVGLKLLRRYAARVWQVELASLRDTDLMAEAIAEVLGLEDVGDVSW